MFRKSRKIHPTNFTKPEIIKPNFIDKTRPLKDEDTESVYKTKTGNLRVVIPKINYNNKMVDNNKN